MNEVDTRTTVAHRYPYLQGLLYVPIGLWLAVVAIVSSDWWPWNTGGRGLLVMVPAGVVAALACQVITRYYQRHFGRVVLPRERRVGQLLLTVAAMLAIVAATIVGELFRSPVNLYGVAVALAQLTLWAYGGIIRPHHILFTAGLLLLSMVPLGGTGLLTGDHATTSMVVVLLGMGVVDVCVGLIDHAYLVRWLGPARKARTGEGRRADS